MDSQHDDWSENATLRGLRLAGQILAATCGEAVDVASVDDLIRAAPEHELRVALGYVVGLVETLALKAAKDNPVRARRAIRRVIQNALPSYMADVAVQHFARDAHVI